MTHFRKLSAIACAAFMLAALSACSSPVDQLKALPQISLSPELAAIYTRSCKNCHEVPATTAPQTGDYERWASLLEKPFEQVMAAVLEGSGGMPPLGQCFECTTEQLESLVHFMSRPKRSTLTDGEKSQ